MIKTTRKLKRTLTLSFQNNFCKKVFLKILTEEEP